MSTQIITDRNGQLKVNNLSLPTPGYNPKKHSSVNITKIVDKLNATALNTNNLQIQLQNTDDQINLLWNELRQFQQNSWNPPHPYQPFDYTPHNPHPTNENTLFQNATSERSKKALDALTERVSKIETKTTDVLLTALDSALERQLNQSNKIAILEEEQTKTKKKIDDLSLLTDKKINDVKTHTHSIVDKRIASFVDLTTKVTSLEAALKKSEQEIQSLKDWKTSHLEAQKENNTLIVSTLKRLDSQLKLTNCNVQTLDSNAQALQNKTLFGKWC